MTYDDLNQLDVQPVTAAEAGIDAGAAGALGASRGLLGLMKARIFAQRIAQAQSNFEREQTLREQEVADNRRRLDQADARQAALDARMDRSAKDAENKLLLAQVSEQPHAQLTGTQLENMGVGKDSPLRGTRFKSLQETLGGKSLVGMSGTAGTPQQSQGQITATPHAAVGPDTYEVVPTFSEDMRQQAQDLNEMRAQITQKLGEAKNENERQHWQNMLDAANLRTTAAESRRNTLTPSQTLNEISALNKAYNGNTKGERQVMQNYAQMQTALKSLDDPNVQNQTAATKAVIDAFERTLNPMGVVRQTAFAQDVGHQSVLDTLWGRLQQMKAGGHGMAPQNLRAFAAQVEPLARAAQQKIDREKTRISNMASSYSLPLDQIFADEDNPFAAPAADAAAPGAGGPGSTPSGRKYRLIDSK